MRVVGLPGNSLPFGVAVEDFDPVADLAQLQALVLAKLVVVVRGQAALSPAQQLALTRSFDPESGSYGHGHNQQLMAASVLQSDLISIPAVPQVKLLGNGPVEGHEGLAHADLKHPQHFTFHKHPLSAEQTAQGLTRFYRWHMDAALYALHPPVVTTLLALEVPSGRRQTVDYGDGSGDQIPGVSLGTTAFVSGELAFAALSPELQGLALQTRVRYAPHPYIWIKQAKARSTGLGIVCDGLEVPLGELPPWTEEAVMTYPAVWRTPGGQPSLQIHGCCVADLVVDGVPMNDLAKARETVDALMRPGIAPALVLTHDWAAGDLVLFSNRCVWHSVVGTLGPDERRVFHQCNLGGTKPPEGYAR